MQHNSPKLDRRTFLKTSALAAPAGVCASDPEGRDPHVVLYHTAHNAAKGDAAMDKCESYHAAGRASGVDHKMAALVAEERAPLRPARFLPANIENPHCVETPR